MTWASRGGTELATSRCWSRFFTVPERLSYRAAQNMRIRVAVDTEVFPGRQVAVFNRMEKNFPATKGQRWFQAVKAPIFGGIFLREITFEFRRRVRGSGQEPSFQDWMNALAVTVGSHVDMVRNGGDFPLCNRFGQVPDNAPNTDIGF